MRIISEKGLEMQMKLMMRKKKTLRRKGIFHIIIHLLLNRVEGIQWGKGLKEEEKQSSFDSIHFTRDKF